MVEDQDLSEKNAGTRGRWLLLFVVCLITVIADQVSKEWAAGPLRATHGGLLPLFDGVISGAFAFVRNPGVAWGLFANVSPGFRRPFLLGSSLVAMVFVLVLFVRSPPWQWLLRVALSLIMGGAIGNFIDRFRHDYVVDFVSLRLGTLRWPTFNVADVAISCGVLLLLAEVVLTARHTSAPSAPKAT